MATIVTYGPSEQIWNGYGCTKGLVRADLFARSTPVFEKICNRLNGLKLKIIETYNIVDERDLKEAAQKLDQYLAIGHNLRTPHLPTKFP